nr:protein BatD [Gemmatimonadota bacterium]
MRRFTWRSRGAALAGALLWAWPLPAAAQVEVRGEVARDTVALNESIEYRITVRGTGVRDVEDPQLELPGGLTLFGRSKTSEVSVVNGAVERTTRFSFVYRPFRTGLVTIGPARVQVGSARHSAASVEVTVVTARAPSAVTVPAIPDADGADSRLSGLDDVADLPPVFVTNRLDRDEAWVGEQVVLSFAFYQSPRAVVLDQPNYSSAKTPGFWTQDFNREPEISRELFGGEPYTIQRFHYALFPLTAGTKDISPASLTLTLRRPGSIFDRGRTRTLSGDTLRLNVRPLPVEGRPAAFAGAVGRYRLQAALEPREVEQNAPATLVLTVTGEGNLATLPRPRLSLGPGVRIFDPEVETHVTPRGLTVRGEKTFTYLVIPQRGGTLELGRAALDYFDPSTGAYASADAALGRLAVRATSGALAARDGDGWTLAGIRTKGLEAVPPAPWRTPLFWGLVALPLIGLAALLLS